MPVEYVDLETAKQHSGLRMVVVPGVPSPWGEAAKGILHVKGIPWVAVRLDPRDKEMAAWTGCRSAPVAVYSDEPPRSGWSEILLLAERLAPAPTLLPSDPEERALAMGLAHELCGEQGLGWCRRLQSVHGGLRGDRAGYPKHIAAYLAVKYGHRPEEADGYEGRIVAILGMLGARLRAQHAAGSRYYFHDALTAVDIYSAAFMGIFQPLPAEQCAMHPRLRGVFEHTSPAIAEALDPILLAHRDHIYAHHLELPLSL